MALLDLTGKAALITGGKRIGAAIAVDSRGAGWTSHCRISGRATTPRRRQRKSGTLAGVRS